MQNTFSFVIRPIMTVINVHDLDFPSLSGPHLKPPYPGTDFKLEDILLKNSSIASSSKLHIRKQQHYSFVKSDDFNINAKITFMINR